jgi:uncharacterized protein (TIRG00374 family)
LTPADAPIRSDRDMESRGPRRPAFSFGRRAARVALVAAGVGLAVWLFRAVGWPAIESNLRAIGLFFFVLVGLYGFAQAFFALGWWIVLDPRPPLSAFPRLFAAYLAGDATNYLTPGGIAGEPLKVQLLSARMETDAALASVTVHKQVDLLAQWVFVLAGVGVTLATFPLSAGARAGALLGAALFGAMLFGLTWAMRRGTYGRAVRWLSRFRALSERLLPHHERARAADERIRRFPRERRGRFAAAVAVCFLGWCGGALETWLVLRRIAPEAPWTAAVGIEALSMVLVTLLLFLPGRIGGAEGARTGVCVLLGLTAAQGVAYGLVRRARELAWLLPGLVVLLARAGRGGRAARGPDSVPGAGLANGGARP